MLSRIRVLMKESLSETSHFEIKPSVSKSQKPMTLNLLMYRAHALDDSLATELYRRLLDMAPWKKADEIRSRKTGFTRKARKVGITDQLFIELIPYVEDILKTFGRSYAILGLYLNWYENGQSYTPSHTHETDQLVISLGATRILRVGSQDFPMKHGDAVLFGTQPHSVPQETLHTDSRFPEGRISIATFMIPHSIELTLGSK